MRARPTSILTRCLTELRDFLFIFTVTQVNNMPLRQPNRNRANVTYAPPPPTPVEDDPPSEAIDIEEDDHPELGPEESLGSSSLGSEDEGDLSGSFIAPEDDMDGQPPKRRRLAHSRVPRDVARKLKRKSREAAMPAPRRRTTATGPRTTQWCYTLNNPGKNSVVLSYMAEIHPEPDVIMYQRRSITLHPDGPLTRSKVRFWQAWDSDVCDLETPEFNGYSLPYPYSLPRPVPRVLP